MIRISITLAVFQAIAATMPVGTVVTEPGRDERGEGVAPEEPLMSWIFKGIAYQTKRDYYAAIVREWLTAGGLNLHEFVRKSFTEISDVELADQVIASSSLGGQQPPFERDDIAQAFADYRKIVEASPVEAHDASLREKILDEIRTVAAEQNRTLAPLTDDLALAESGLDSLCFAILVARLEDITGRDPLTSAADARFPRTVGEFIELYEKALLVGEDGGLSAARD